MWHFLWNSQNLITEHLTWKIGHGHRANFWCNSWNGDPPLINYFEDINWATEIEVVMGDKVDDYFSSQENYFLVSWKSVGSSSLKYQRKLSDLL